MKALTLGIAGLALILNNCSTSLKVTGIVSSKIMASSYLQTNIKNYSINDSKPGNKFYQMTYGDSLTLRFHSPKFDIGSLDYAIEKDSRIETICSEAIGKEHDFDIDSLIRTDSFYDKNPEY